MTRRSEALRVVGDPYRETPPEREKVGPREVSMCVWCEFKAHEDVCVGPYEGGRPVRTREPIGVYPMRSRKAFRAAVDEGACSFYRPSAWTRFLRLFGLRNPVVR